MNRLRLLLLALCSLPLASTGLTRDEVAADPTPSADVRAALAAGPTQEPFEDTFSDLSVSASPPPQVVIEASGGRQWVVRVRAGVGESPRLIHLGRHLARFAGSKRPSLVVVDDEGRVREYVVLHDRHPLPPALSEVGVDLSAWRQDFHVGLEIPPILVDLPDGGWLFYGRGRHSGVTRGLTPPMDHVGGVASLGAASWNPAAPQVADAALGSETITIMSSSDAAGCSDLTTVPARLGALTLSGLPSIRETVASARTLRFEDGQADVAFAARDMRPRSSSGGAAVHGPTAGTMMLGAGAAPVDWQGSLDGADVGRLLSAVEAGLRCVGEADGRPNHRDVQARLSLQPKGGPHVELARTADGWVLNHLASRGAWRMEDTGLMAGLEALWALTEPGAEEAWAAVDARCPPPLEGAEIAGMVFDYQWSGLHGRRVDLWEWDARADGWGWLRQRSEGARDAAPDTTSGFVDAAVVDALLAAASEEVSCQTEGYSVTTHTDDYPKWTLKLTLADGRLLTLSSESNTRLWQPWLVQIGDYSGVQEGGETGTALKALLAAVEASAGR